MNKYKYMGACKNRGCHSMLAQLVNIQIKQLDAWIKYGCEQYGCEYPNYIYMDVNKAV
jgi:hypothetical protein